MSIFKRLSATFVSSIDQVVGEIENHDAVVQASLQDMRKQIAEAKVRLSQVHREQASLQEQIREQQDGAQRWRERALACSKSDEGKALECLSRSRHCQQQAERLEQALAGFESTAEKLAVDIEASEQRLAQNKQKLTLMRARQSTSSALNATGEEGQDASQLMDDTFDRWEINISQAEMVSDGHPAIDPLEREFTTREQQGDLRRELAALRAEEEQK
jgi:phage shock protein A